MSQVREPETRPRACPSCGEQLHREGELLRCKQHGLFFSYGPRLLVHVASPENSQTPLLPWQTIKEPISQ